VKRKPITGPLVKGIIFAVVTVLATAVLGITIANTGVGNTNDYDAQFTDVTALNVGDDVRIAGVRVGQVERIGVVNHRIAQVTFSVASGRQLPASTTATIKYRNLVGQRYIALDQGTGPLNAILPAGGTIPLSRTTPALDLTDLFNGFKPLFQALSPNDVNQLSNEIIQVLQGEGGTMASLISNTASLTTTLAGKDQVIGQVIDNLNSVLTTVNSRGGEFTNLVNTLQQLVSGLAQDRQPIGNAISALDDLSNSTANLLQQGRDPLKQDISALGAVSTNLADNSGLVNSFLQNLPAKMTKIGTLASYGSWMNFYLCSATTSGVTTIIEPGTNTGPGVPGSGSNAPMSVGVPVTAARCQS
jgi:phospholipid/cholesterol/gamma-HCH transport system substrate-binding protein